MSLKGSSNPLNIGNEMCSVILVIVISFIDGSQSSDTKALQDRQVAEKVVRALKTDVLPQLLDQGVVSIEKHAIVDIEPVACQP